MPRRPVCSVRSIVLVAATLTLALPGSAGAAKPFLLDPSEAANEPTIEVDGSGTAHAAWNLDGPSVADDSIVYCQVPRGKRACASKVTLAAPLDSVSPPHVLLADDGGVLIVTSRCCKGVSGYPTYLFTSSDGGGSFSAPLEIGNNQASGDAELGPGGFSVSTISDVTTGGVTYQADPLSGPSPPHVVNLGEIPGTFGADYFGSIAFLDPATPIVAMDDLETVYFRLFAGGTAYNEISGWGSLEPVGPGDSPQLASLPSGKKGVHLLYRVGKPGKWRLIDKRFKGGSFGKETTVSETGDPIFHTFFMDASGRVQAIWVNNDDDSLRRSFQPSGKAWEPIETLLGKGKADRVFNTKAAAAKDGGGFVVWDANNAGPVRALPFGPSGKPGAGKKGGGACVDELKVGGATVIAQEGCLQQDPKQKDRYTTSGDVRVNGIEILLGAGAGSSATASAAPKLIVDKGDRSVTTTGKVSAKVGNVVLGHQELQWRIPPGKGQITDFAGNPAAFDPGGKPESVLGLQLLGYTVPSLSGQESSELPINLSLPAPFDSVLGDKATGSATLRTTNNTGLKLSGLKVHVQDVSLGIAQLKTFNIVYVDDPNLVQGDTDILLPPSGAELNAAFGLRNGDFDYGRGEFTFPPGQLAVATNVLLRKIKFAVEAASGCDKPTKISGGVTLTTGPVVAGTGLISIDGDVSYSFPRSSCGTPGVLQADGTGALAGIPVANIHARFTTDGQLTFGADAHLDLGVASANVGFNGGVDIPSKTFYAEGHGSLTALSFTVGKLDAIVSSVGMAGCGSAGKFIEGGFEYHWGEGFGSDNVDYPPDCNVDMGDFKPAAFSSALLARVSAVRASFKLPRGLRSATVRLDGAGGAPGFALKGPGGLDISYPSAGAGTVSGDHFAVVPVGTQTFVRIQGPAAGTYSVSDAPGPAIAGLAVAHGLPNPKVTGKVLGGKGRKRTLSFKARPIEGQSVTFVEEGRGVKSVIAASKQRRGTIHFRPALGPAGKRTVLAIVSQDGVPRAEIEVARFTAPSSLPGRPRGVRLTRTGKGLRVSWRAAPGASRVAVSYALADGRHLAEVVRGHRALIANVPGIDSGRVEVAGLRRDNVAGKSVTLKLKPKPKRLKKRRGARARRR